MPTIRVLHLADEPDVHEVVSLLLGLEDEFEVRACRLGLNALDLATEWSPSVILVDVEMPVMDGPAMLANLRKHPGTAHIPVLFMAARTVDGAERRFTFFGAQAVIVKPFEPLALSALIRRHLPSSHPTWPEFLVHRCAVRPEARGGGTRAAGAEGWPPGPAGAAAGVASAPASGNVDGMVLASG